MLMHTLLIALLSILMHTVCAAHTPNHTTVYIDAHTPNPMDACTPTQTYNFVHKHTFYHTPLC